MGLDSKNAGSRDDADDVFRAAIEYAEGDSCGAPKKKPEDIQKGYLSKLLADEFDLQIDVEDILQISKSDTITRDAMADFLTTSPNAATASA